MASPRLLAYADRVKRQHHPRGRAFVMGADAWPQINFLRHHQGELEKSAPPLEPLWHSWAAGFACVAFIAATILLALVL